MAKVIPLRSNVTHLSGVPEQKLATPPAFTSTRRTPDQSPTKIDLSGKPKLWLLNGAGSSGKSSLARWLLWRMQVQGREAAIAALDPGNRSLSAWFEDVQMPPARDGVASARWMLEILESLIEDPFSAVFDFGAGSTVLERLAESTPGLDIALSSAGLGVVSVYVVTPRVDDLVIPQMIESAGFQPDATLLVLNEGRADPTIEPEQAFAEVCRHSVFRQLVGRGAQVIWMPALETEVMQEIEAKRLSFGQARDGQVPDGAGFPPIGGLRRARVGRWLALVEQAFAPVASWLP